MTITTASHGRPGTIATGGGLIWLRRTTGLRVCLRIETLEAFRHAFATLGYMDCDHGELEAGYEKIAIFALSGVPKHAARQLPSGRWTSKLGKMEDIEHTLHDVTGTVYGGVVHVMRRPLPLAEGERLNN